MDYEIDDIECAKCGHHSTHSRRCSEITCEEGYIDESDEDFLLPGTNMAQCETCKGSGIERWCPSCGADLSGHFAYDDEDEFENCL